MKNIKLKIVPILSFVFSFMALVLISSSKVNGYEHSIYSGTPNFSFIFLILSTIFGVYLILTQENPNFIFWRLGYLNILLNNVILILLPVLKGYAFNERSDVLTHIGYVIDINTIGHFDSDNFYPITHILLSEISQVANLQAITTFRLSPSIFYVIFALNMYFFAKSIFEDNRIISMVVASSSILFLGKYQTMIVPNGICNMFFPLVLAIYFKNFEVKATKFAIPLVLFLIVFPFFHPLSSLALILAFITIEISKYVLSKFTSCNKVTITHILILSLTFITWISSYVVWSRSVRGVFNKLSNEITATPIDAMVTDLTKINITLLDFIELFIRLYGITILYILFSFIGIYYIAICIHNKDNTYYKISILALCLIFFLIFCILMLFIPLGFSPLRIVTYINIISLVVGSFGLFKLSKQKIKNQYLVFLLLLIPLTIGIFNIYDSPLVMKPNPQITSEEYCGWGWFFDHKEEHIQVRGIMSSQPYRFFDFLHGFEGRLNRKDVNPQAPSVPDHFSYNESSQIGDSYTNPIYIPLSTYDKKLYVDVWNMVGRYNETDFELLERDESAFLFYSSNGFDVWYITPR
ncbi:hypothetical protein MSMTP_0158 [Methanosarcina sp. MTP4]|uniref:hypothetical protein n=1 Tax=Methanosarcina sp. MTP4 TaxID=1434100 RepID=UPI0006155E16|nr:hypothetical protein [Methanosarcina sp. MTP4]AKB23627.1 hypothetical protein MSMTP_0158 [Methanosarcina sp. MTP4]